MVSEMDTVIALSGKDETIKKTGGTKNRLINPNLVLLKVSLFLIFGATSSLVPYLTVHMQSLGLTVEEIAAVYLTLLFTTCFSPPITGYIVDRFGRPKPVLLITLVLNLAAHHVLDLVPIRQPWELRSTTLNVSLVSTYTGTMDLNEPCSNGGCPTLSIIEEKLMEKCTVAPSNATKLEIFATTRDDKQQCGVVTLSNCMLQQSQFVNIPMMVTQCPNTTEYDRTFWYYLLFRFIASAMLTASLTMTDSMALSMAEQYGGDFGQEKLFSSVGMAIFTPFTGLLIDYFSNDSHSSYYTPAFYIYDLLLGLALISVFLLPAGKKLPSKSIMKHLWEVLRLPHVLMFLFFLFFLGNFWGFIESYLFVIMKEMGSPNYLLGLTYTVGTVASIPMMYLTGPITRWVGHVNLLVIAFFAHALRILAYSFMSNPFWCFPVELNEGVSCYFMWVVATMYCSVLAPNNLVATLIGISGMAHFCLGKGIGSFFGGYLIAEFGTRRAFRYMGYIALGCGCTYKLIHAVWLKKYDKHEVANADQCEEIGFQERRISIALKYSQFGSIAVIPDNDEQKKLNEVE